MSWLRYEGHLNLQEVGVAGQSLLKRASVLCVGAGGLGCPVSLYLAAAGVGRLGLIDSDEVEESNLQRQVLYGERDLGQSKASLARKTLENLNSSIHVDDYPIRLDEEGVERLFPQYDIIVDATDNFSTRTLINAGSVRFQKPLVSASVFRFEGQISVFTPPQGPCYECLFPVTRKEIEEDLSCSVTGVFSPITGILGSLQANEVLKLILGIGKPLVGRLLVVDSLTSTTDIFHYSKDPHCSRCGVPNNVRQIGLPQRVSQCDAGMEPFELLSLLQTPETLFLLNLSASEDSLPFRIPHSLSAPLGELLRNPEQYRVKGCENFVVYCGSELRARRAVESLREVGISARYLRGGLRKWIQQNYPVEELE